MTDDTARTTIRRLMDDLSADAARADVLRRALLLYMIAMDAQERGDRLAVLGMDGAVVHEVVGLTPPPAADAVDATKGRAG